MSDAPGQVADVPLIVVAVDSLVVRRWVSASISALSGRHPRLRIAVVDASQPGAAQARPRFADSVLRSAMRPAPDGAYSFDTVDDTKLDLVRVATKDELDAALHDAKLVVDLRRRPGLHAQGEQLVLTLCHGATPATSPTALLREVASGRPTVTTTVVARGADAQPVVVASARTALTRRSFKGSLERVAWKSPTLLLRGIDTIVRGNEPNQALPGAGRPVGNLAVATGAARLAGHVARSTITSLATQTNYAVAWGARSPGDSPLQLPKEMHWVEHPADRFLADPFLAREGDRTFVFAEDFSRRDGYATIGVFEPRAASSTFRTVLDRGTHLSYPFVFRDPDTADWLMLPEMAAERRVTLFRASSFPDDWQEDTVLLDDIAAYDPTIVERDGTFWLFYASGSRGSALDDELHLAFATTLRGPYTPHPSNPVKSDVMGSRPAGRLFDWNGKLVRPAQDSSGEYGYAVVFHEVTALTPTSFAETPLARLVPDWAPKIRGTHSWDVLDDIVVTDAKRVLPKRSASRLTSARAR